MNNKAMQRKLENGKALDVRKIGRFLPKAEGVFDSGVFEIPEYAFEDDVDYCDAQAEDWIWSVGRRAVDQVIFAAFDTRYYQMPGYECLWLR